MTRIHIGLLAAAAVGLLSAQFVLRPHLPAAERGRRLAERMGCFACHGPEGTRGTANHGRTDHTVPTWEGDVMMYARSPDEIREWIRDGVTQRRAASRTWQEQKELAPLRMPAFKGRFGDRHLDDLVAFVQVMAGNPSPEDSLAAMGLGRADSLGCVGCHGPGGRLARPNPGSLKGYVPSWDEADFPELVRDSAEFREWVEGGISRRFEANPAAKFFLGRASLRMPAYRKRLAPGEVEALWAYVRWLRSPAGAVVTRGAAAEGDGP